MTFSEKTTLGRTGLPVGRLGISSSFGAPATAFEEAITPKTRVLLRFCSS